MVDSVPYFQLAAATPAATADPFEITVMRQGNNNAAADVRWSVANAAASDPVAVAVPATMAGAGTLSFAAAPLDRSTNSSATIEVERTVPGPVGTGNANITVSIIADPADPDTYGRGTNHTKADIPISRAAAANMDPTAVDDSFGISSTHTRTVTLSGNVITGVAGTGLTTEGGATTLATDIMLGADMDDGGVSNLRVTFVSVALNGAVNEDEAQTPGSSGTTVTFISGQGSLTINETGAFTYTPPTGDFEFFFSGTKRAIAAGETGTISVAYRIADMASPAETDDGLLTITVTAPPADDTPRMALASLTPTITSTTVTFVFQRVVPYPGTISTVNAATADVTPLSGGGRYLPTDKVVATIPAGEFTASLTINRTTDHEPNMASSSVGQLVSIAASGTTVFYTAGNPGPQQLTFLMTDSVPYFGLADATPAATADPFNVTVMRLGNNGAAADVRWSVTNADASDPVAVAMPATLAGAGTVSFAASDGTSNRSGTFEVERTVPGPAGTGNANITVSIIADPADPDTYGRGTNHTKADIPISRAPVANTAPTVVSSATADSATEGTAYSQPLAPFFNDADGDTLTFAITSCPGFALNTAGTPAGALAGTHLVGTGAGGAVTVLSNTTCAITASDNINPAVPHSFTIFVIRTSSNDSPRVINGATVEDATPGAAYRVTSTRHPDLRTGSSRMWTGTP